MSTHEISIEYKRLKQKLTDNIGFEETIDELQWNESIAAEMEHLLKDVNPEITKLIRLNLI